MAHKNFPLKDLWKFVLEDNISTKGEVWGLSLSAAKAVSGRSATALSWVSALFHQ